MTDSLHPAPPPELEPAERPIWRRRPRATAAVAGAALLVMLLAWLSWALPLGRALEPLPDPTLVLVTADGKPFARRGSYKEAPVVASKLPKHVAGAFVSIEDRRFYSHAGPRPARHRPRHAQQRPSRGDGGGRLDPDPAAGQERLPLQ
jgi:penicillin-binding protein 1A